MTPNMMHATAIEYTLWVSLIAVGGGNSCGDDDAMLKGFSRTTTTIKQKDGQC